MSTVETREARGADIEEIQAIFLEAYGEDYPYRYFYDPEWLKRAIYGDQMVMVVAEDPETGQILGTGSVDFDIGAHSDLVGEFGRLAVHEDARGRGVATRIMKERIELIERRLHVGIVENRTNHPYSQRISERFDFAPVGFLPLKHRFQTRESIASFARHFGPALKLRRNNPRLIPSIAPLAHLAMANLKLEPDLIVDESAPPYPLDEDFQISQFDSEGLPALLRIERGRVKARDVFGPIRLHQGFFKLAARHASYLIARRPGAPKEAVSGAIGYLHDEFERNIRIFELIAADDASIRFLLLQILEEAAAQGVEYMEIEVNAHGPRLQRTLYELGFLPAAYIPAMVFHEVERLDIIKMVRLLIPSDLGDVELIDSARPLFDLVMQRFRTEAVLPKIAAHIQSLQLFDDLSLEQARRIASVMSLQEFSPREFLFKAHQNPDRLFVLIDGPVQITTANGTPLGIVGPGHTVGENALLTDTKHSASARALEKTTAAVLTADELFRITRQRPDIAVLLYRNLAIDLGQKLRQASQSSPD